MATTLKENFIEFLSQIKKNSKEAHPELVKELTKSIQLLQKKETIIQDNASNREALYDLAVFDIFSEAKIMTWENILTFENFIKKAETKPSFRPRPKSF